MKFSLFRKPKKQPEETAAPLQEEPKTQTTVATEDTLTTPQEPKPETTSLEEKAIPAPMQKNETAESLNKTYLKAIPLKELTDIEKVKDEVRNGNIIILRVTPLANKSLDDVKNAVNDLYQFSESIGGDIARLGEERVVICPKNIRIWREKTPTQNEPLPTAA